MKRNTIYALACLLFFMASCQKTEILEVQGGEEVSFVQGKKDGDTYSPISSSEPDVDFSLSFVENDNDLTLYYEGVTDGYQYAQDFSWSVVVEDNAGGVPCYNSTGGPCSISNSNLIIPESSTLNSSMLSNMVSTITTDSKSGTTTGMASLTNEITSTTNEIVLPHNGISTIFYVSFSASVDIDGTMTQISLNTTLRVYPDYGYAIQIIGGTPLYSHYNSNGGPGLGASLIGTGG